ncbi:CLUMA_CG003392, isoform A [Clunio marinus]|uniref:CLUMA_CG003392, isoform A n=1 Tax=Clunio marinus TaxID=568069 RepID=A0A1J1HQD5_9DIPT|nr:CLUMA_CG003392, isoform A [Clunio marinus]
MTEIRTFEIRYFSLVNEKGTTTATQYTTMTQLVRERVYKFLSIDNMQAYTESNPNDNTSSKSHYVKITAKAGEVFRLLAGFEDGSQDSKSYASPKKDNLNSIGREKEKGRYVQLMSENRQIIFVSLSTKGKFYEIEHSSVPQMLTKHNNNINKTKPLNADCVHRISSIIKDDAIFPINLKFISKHSSGLMQSGSIPEHIRITRVSIENSVIACPIDEAEFCNPLHLVKLYLHPEMKFIKCSLGFESEKVMFSNQNVQNLLKFCQFNCDNFMRAIEYETLPKESITKSTDNLSSLGKVKAKAPSAFSKFFSSEKNSSAHEREDSIIFLSKNDLENMEQQKQLTQESDKMKPFQASKKSWFKNLRNGSSSNNNTNSNSNKTNNSFINLNSNSMDRYQDMSKMIQERFGTIEINERGEPSSTTIKSSSEISYDLNDRTNRAMQKCFSLQNIELNSMDMSMQAPDLVVKHQRQNTNRNASNDDKIEKDETYVSHTSSSNDSALNNSDPNQPKQKSFITEKLFNEFYVKTKQYSKSSSSLHQLLHFSVPQKMNIRETRKRLEKVEDEKRQEQEEESHSALLHLQLPPPPSTEPPESDNEPNNDAVFGDNVSIVTDDLPYCSVRDSIFQNNNDRSAPRETPTESIYAEICATPPPVSSDTSEVSYRVEKPMSASIKKQNVSSIRISFGHDSVPTILSNGSNISYNK